MILMVHENIYDFVFFSIQRHDNDTEYLFVQFLLCQYIVFIKPSWPIFLKLNLSDPIYLLKRELYFYVLSQYYGMYKIL